MKLINCLPLKSGLYALGVCVAFYAGPVFSEEAVHPTVMKNVRNAGTLFSGHTPVIQQHEGDSGSYTTEDVEVFLSNDRKFDAGMYRSGAARHVINEPYGVNEFMHFLEGGVTLTSADGWVLEIRAGDAVVIPADWRGVWDTQGYTKIYVIYSPDGPIE